MDNCLSLLKLYAGLKKLDPSVTEEVDRHLDTCDACADAAFHLTQLLVFPPDNKANIPEEKIPRLLNAVYHQMGPSDRKTVAVLFSSESGREFVENVARYEYASAAPPDALVDVISHRLRELAKNRKRTSYIPRYVLKLIGSMEKKIGELQKTTRRLITVIQVPSLSPALAELRSPLYDDIAILENRASVELPFYYDADSILRLHLQPDNECLRGELQFFYLEEEQTIRSTTINGVEFPGGSFETKQILHIDIEFTVDNIGSYCAKVDLQM
jgi:hypothetical protein